MPNSSRSRSSKRYPVSLGKGRLRQKLRREKKRQRKKRRTEVRYTSRTLTAYGFFSPRVLVLLEVLPGKEAFASQISLAHPGKEFTVADFCITLVILPILGIKRISHIDDNLRSESTLASMVGMTRFCCPKTLPGFLNRGSGGQVRQVDRVTTTLVGAHLEVLEEELDPRELRIVDMDGSTRSTEGRKRQKAKPGKNPKAKGKDCSLGRVAVFGGLILPPLLDSGKGHCKHPLKALGDQAQKILARIDLLRIDGGYLWGMADLNSLGEQPSAFLAKGKANFWAVHQAIAKATPGDWHPIEKSTAILDAGWVRLFEGTTHPVRLVVVRARKRIKRTQKGRGSYKTTTIF